jgi:hypothetical protein
MQPRSLKQITGDRARCQYCNKPLKPQTSLLELAGHLDGPPDAQEQARVAPMPNSFWTPERALKNGYAPELVFRLRHEEWNKQPFTLLKFWTRRYEGYGFVFDGPLRTSLFCGYMCAVHFGVACWKAGMRIKEKPSVSVTSTPSTPNKDNRNAEDSVL